MPRHALELEALVYVLTGEGVSGREKAQLLHEWVEMAGTLDHHCWVLG